MAPIMKNLKKLYSFFLPLERSSSSLSDRRTVDGEADEEDFTYPTTRCLSSYYSIFVARLAIMVWTSLRSFFVVPSADFCSSHEVDQSFLLKANTVSTKSLTLQTSFPFSSLCQEIPVHMHACHHLIYILWFEVEDTGCGIDPSKWESVFESFEQDECPEIDPIHFEDVSSDESSDIENSSTINNAINLEGRTREVVSASQHSCHQTAYSVEESKHEVSLPNIHQNTHLLLEEETVPKLSKDFTDAVNCGINNTDPPKCYGHKGISQDTMREKGEKLKDFQPPLGIISSEKYSDVIVEINQLHSGEENMAEQENQYRHAEQVKKDYRSKRLTKVIDRNNNLDNYHSTIREGTEASTKMAPNQGALNGLYILLAEDNPILQRVATAMLQKVGATVVSVGDGMQAVDALKCMFCAEEGRRQTLFPQEGKNRAMKQLREDPPFDLILMDCQMPKLDGYEATIAIRKLEEGTGSHIPIVAVTAHAMSSDEAKCLEVGMDAYLTKPIDCNLMVSTILAFTQRNG